MPLSITRPKHRSFTNPSLFHLFSTSSSPSNYQNDPNNNDTPQSESPSQSQSSFSSYFSDVKASLRHRNQQMENQTLNQYSRRSLPQQQQTSPLNRPSKIASLEEIKKNLSEFRLRSSVPLPTDPNPSSHSSRKQPISFQELYKRNVTAKSEDAADGGMVSSPPKPSGNFSFEAIRDSLRQMRSNREANIERRGGDLIPLDTLKNNLRLKPNPAGSSGSTVIGGTGGLSFTVFGKEMKESNEEKGTEATGMEFVKMYKHDELGEKLRILRPMDGVKDFSLHELSERLIKLREIEEKEATSRVTGFVFKDLRDSLNMLKMSDDEKTRRNSIQRLDILGKLIELQTLCCNPQRSI